MEIRNSSSSKKLIEFHKNIASYKSIMSWIIYYENRISHITFFFFFASVGSFVLAYVSLGFNILSYLKVIFLSRKRHYFYNPKFLFLVFITSLKGKAVCRLFANSIHLNNLIKF